MLTASDFCEEGLHYLAMSLIKCDRIMNHEIIVCMHRKKDCIQFSYELQHICTTRRKMEEKISCVNLFTFRVELGADLRPE